MSSASARPRRVSPRYLMPRQPSRAKRIHAPKRAPSADPSPLRGIAQNRLSADDECMRGLKDWRREDGQTMAEYGVILAVITPAIVAAIALLAFAIAGNLGAVADLFS